MTDVHSKEVRSYNMSRIRSSDTKPELRVRKACHALGLRFRLHKKDLPGKPDLVFPKYKSVILVHGCFWHFHSCKEGKRSPKTNSDYWIPKREATKARDARNRLNLEKLNWRVLEYWDCETKNLEKLVERIRKDFDLSE